MSSPLAPHPPLTDYYEEPSRRTRFVRDLFDDTAPWYDTVNNVVSFGSGHRYRRDALARNGLKSGMRLLDVATGTGVVARAAATITGDVIGLDPSIGMLLAGRAKRTLPAIQAIGEQLPIRSASVDFITIGFALRHLADLRTAFAEYRRVLRPGGKLLILEITPPRSRVARAWLRTYMRGVVPIVARITTRRRDTAKLMRYYWDTIDACVPPGAIIQALNDVGFKASRDVQLGVFSEYLGVVSG